MWCSGSMADFDSAGSGSSPDAGAPGVWWLTEPSHTPQECPVGPHLRYWPEGPNEDWGRCRHCHTRMGVLRPDGEMYGGHLANCSLPVEHKGFCVGGGMT